MIKRFGNFFSREKSETENSRDRKFKNGGNKDLAEKLTPENVDDYFDKNMRGIEVKVQRSSGKIDEGWEVTKIHEGIAIVIKRNEDGGILQKHIPLEELIGVNKKIEQAEASENIAEKLTPENVDDYFDKNMRGIEVKVQRSSGKIDEGWEVTKIHEGIAIVIKRNEDGRILQKHIPLEELLKINK